jgi:hypothetical protein
LSRRFYGLAAVAGAILSLSAPAALAASSAPPGDTCFWSADWQGWKSPSPDVIYLHVGASQVFQLTLKQGSDQLKYPDVRLINQNQQSSWLCTPHDFNLLLTDRDGILRQPLFVQSITKLTADQIAAIPHKYRP